MNKKVMAAVISGGVAVTALVVGVLSYGSMMGHNEAGQRHFVQTFTGNTKVVYEGGPFWYGNGSKTPYMNSLRTIKTPVNRACDYESNDGFSVQYGDGGKGSICAQFDAQLSMDEGVFQALHQKYRSEEGVRGKLLMPNYNALFTTTAELFTSTEAYETKRSQIANAIQEQLNKGPYVTTTKTRDIVVGVDDQGVNITQAKAFSVIARDAKGTPLHQENPFAAWDMSGVNAPKVTITGFDFEPKTMQQISDRRDATNRGETAQAKAKAAYWEGKKAEAEGEAARIKAQALAEVNNAKAIADAKRDAELAVIEAKKQAERAKELEIAAVARTAQAKQDAIAADFEAEAITTLAKAEAYKQAEMIKARLPQMELETEVKIAAEFAGAMANMNVPTNMMVNGGGSEGSEGNQLDHLLQLQVMQAFKAQQAGNAGN